ncbi:MAG: hypothetical protein ABEL51_03550 [Salinibacter sp.]
MRHPEIGPLDGSRDPSVCVPLGLIQKATPEDAGDLFDRLFDAAERKFGEYPAFRLDIEDTELLCAKARKEPTQPQRPRP